MLTDEERYVLNLTSEIWNVMNKEVVGSEKNREADLWELSIHIHNIQNMILAQAAAREYPEKYRLLGEICTSLND